METYLVIFNNRSSTTVEATNLADAEKKVIKHYGTVAFTVTKSEGGINGSKNVSK